MTLVTEKHAPEPSPPPTRGPSFFKGVMFTGAGTAFNIVFLFLETMIAVRVLDTESYGIYALLIVVVSFLVMVTDFGSTTAVTQLLVNADPARQSTLVSSVMAFRLAVAVLVSVIVLVIPAAMFLVDPSMAVVDYAIYIPMMLIVVSLDEALQAMLQGHQAFNHMAVANGVRSILRLGLSSAFLLLLHLGMKGLIYSWTISFGAAVIYELMVMPRRGRFVLSRQILGEVLRFGFPLQLNRVLWFVSSRVDVLLVGAFLGPSAVALFDVASRIPNALQRLVQAYTAVFFPKMTELLAGQDKSEAQRLLNRSLRLISFVIAVSALVAVVFSKQIVTILFSEKYAGASWIFALLMIGLQMNSLVTLMGYSLTSAGRPGRSLTTNAIREAMIVISDLVLIPLIGLAGPAWGRLAAYYVANPISVWMLRRSQIMVSTASYIKQTALLWLGVAITWWAQPEGFVARFGIVATFVALSIIWSTITRDDVELLSPRLVMRRRRSRKEIVRQGNA